MVNLIIPQNGPRVRALGRDEVNAYVRSEYDKSIHTWGIPNNLIRTMACLPQLGLTEVDYANSFIFDEGTYIQWPRPGGNDPADTVLFPAAGFVDRVTKELCINLVSLLNRSRYSITHHTVIGFGTLCTQLPEKTRQARARRAEQMLLQLVDHSGRPAFEGRTLRGKPLYENHHLAALRFALKLRGDPHSLSDQEVLDLRSIFASLAQQQISGSALGDQFQQRQPDQAYLDAYVDGMLVEFTWCLVHFSGLLNSWFTVLKIRDEEDARRDGIDFVSHYNKTVPESIKVRNNNLLGADGWGN